jgi:hypothetical protein
MINVLEGEYKIFKSAMQLQINNLELLITRLEVRVGKRKWTKKEIERRDNLVYAKQDLERVYEKVIKELEVIKVNEQI